MILLPASEFTLDELTDAYNQTRTDYLIPMPMNPARLGEYITLYDVDMVASRVAVTGEQVVGLGMLGKRPGSGWLTRLGVLPEGRRQGVGSALLQGLLDQAEAEGLSEVWLEVIKGNEPARQLFLKYGFRPTRELVIGRRPPRAPRDMAAILAADKIDYLQHDEAIELHCDRRVRPNWLNAVESMRNVRRLAAAVEEPGRETQHQTPHLSAILVKFKDGASGWVSYQATALQLKRICLEVRRGDEAAVAANLLAILHRLHATQDATIENIPDDARWQGSQRAGYFEVFRRIEMVRQI